MRRVSGQSCSVLNCKNTPKNRFKIETQKCGFHLNKLRLYCGCPPPYSFHQFPSNSHTKTIWVKNINRKNFIPSKNTKVCSIHFKDGKPTAENPYPVLHLGYSNNLDKVKYRKPPKDRSGSNISNQRENKNSKMQKIKLNNINNNYDDDGHNEDVKIDISEIVVKNEEEKSADLVHLYLSDRDHNIQPHHLEKIGQNDQNGPIQFYMEDEPENEHFSSQSDPLSMNENECEVKMEKDEDVKLNLSDKGGIIIIGTDNLEFLNK